MNARLAKICPLLPFALILALLLGSCGGEDFITLFFRALQKAEELGEPLRIETL